MQIIGCPPNRRNSTLFVGFLLVSVIPVGAYNGNTAGSPETYRCTQINTTPGNVGRGKTNVTCTDSFVSSQPPPVVAPPVVAPPVVAPPVVPPPVVPPPVVPAPVVAPPVVAPPVVPPPVVPPPVVPAPVVAPPVVAPPVVPPPVVPPPVVPAPVIRTPSLTVNLASAPAGTPFTITLTNFPASTTGTVNVLGPNQPVTTDAKGNATVIFKDFSTRPGSINVFATIGNVSNQSPATIQITAPALVGSVSVASNGGCNPVFSGSGFPTGTNLSVDITSPSGTRVAGFSPFQSRPDGTFQLFGGINGINLPAGMLNVVVKAGSNVLNTTPFMQTACSGNQAFIFAGQYQVIAGNPFTFTGGNFTPGSVLTVSARSDNGTLLGSTSVTALSTNTPPKFAGDVSGTLSTTGFPMGPIVLVVTPAGSNTVIAIGQGSIV